MANQSDVEVGAVVHFYNLREIILKAYAEGRAAVPRGEDEETKDDNGMTMAWDAVVAAAGRDTADEVVDLNALSRWIQAELKLARQDARRAAFLVYTDPRVTK